MLIRSINDGWIYRGAMQGETVLPQELQASEIVRGEKTSNEPRIGFADLPEPRFMTVGHEAKRCVRLSFGNFDDVVAELLVSFARMAAAPFCLHDRQHISARVVQTIVRDSVPRLGIVAIDRNLKLHQ
jgi:hypothetical protein